MFRRVTDISDANNPDALAQLLEGRSDEEINQFVEAAGVDTEKALKKLATIPISLHCWQGDDVGGFETTAGALGGGLVATGNYPDQDQS